MRCNTGAYENAVLRSGGKKPQKPAQTKFEPKVRGLGQALKELLLADDKTLSHLLHIEAEASDLVNEAQAKADRRVEEAEKLGHAAFEERYQAEAGRLEAEYQNAKEQARIQYRQELEAYREKLSSLPVNMDRFSALLNGLIAGES